MPTTTNLNDDINATIATAVNARIEAAVMESLSGDDVLARFVTAALTQPVKQDTYDRSPRKTFLAHTVQKAIQDATRAAIEALVEEEKPRIEDECRKALRRNLPAVAERLVDGLRMARYSVSVNVAEES